MTEYQNLFQEGVGGVALTRVTGVDSGRALYNVSYGDEGWEKEPGTWHATRDEAIADVDAAINALTMVRCLLEREPE